MTPMQTGVGTEGVVARIGGGVRRWAAALALVGGLVGSADGQTTSEPVTVIKAGAVVDPITGRTIDAQTIVVTGGKITAIGANLPVPAGATVVDLSKYVVLPGLFDAHTHLTAAYDPAFTNLRDYALIVSTPERALQGIALAWQMMAAGFTTVRDLGNAGNFADAALALFFNQGDPLRRRVYGDAVVDRMAVGGRPIVGPTIVYAGKIIAPFGAQFRVSPEFPRIGEQDYFYADTREELQAAIRQNVHYGATWIKLIVDDQRYAYDVDDLRFAVQEAARGGAKVTTHAVTEAGARASIEAGVASIEHGYVMSDETLRMAKERGVVLVGTDPAGVWMEKSGRSSQDDRTIDRLRRAHRIGVRMAFGADIVRAPTGWYDRGEITMSVIDSWHAAGIPPADLIRAMTTNAAELLGMAQERGVIRPGFAADIIATTGNPLQDVNALKRVAFVMKDGVIFKDIGDRPSRR